MDDKFIILLQKSFDAHGFIIGSPLQYREINFVALPNSKQYSYEYTDTTRNDEEAIKKLIERLFNHFQKGFKFVPLPLPYINLGKTVFLCRHENILARFLQSNVHMSDEYIYRWDFLVLGDLR